MKRSLAVLLAIIFLFSLIGCGNKSKSEANVEQLIEEIESLLAEREEKTTTEETTVEETTTKKDIDSSIHYTTTFETRGANYLINDGWNNEKGNETETSIIEYFYDDSEKLVLMYKHDYIGFDADSPEDNWESFIKGLEEGELFEKIVELDDEKYNNVNYKVFHGKTISKYDSEFILYLIVRNESIYNFSFLANDEVKESVKIILDSVEFTDFIPEIEEETTTVQTTEKTTTATTTTATTTPTTTTARVSREERNALQSAEGYIAFMAFSESGLAKQLEFEGYPQNAIDYAISNITVDYNEMALQCAEGYLDFMAMSDSQLYDQLIFEGYTPEQAQYAIDHLD